MIIELRKLEFARKRQTKRRAKRIISMGFVIDLLKHYQKRTCHWETIQMGEISG